MTTQNLQGANRQTSDLPVMSDPEWIALESLEDQTDHFIFDDAMLQDLHRRGLVEPRGERWRLTGHGRRTLDERANAGA